MKHEPDCGCLTCYQALMVLAEKLQRDLDEMADWNFNRDQEMQKLKAHAERLAVLLAESEKRSA